MRTFTLDEAQSLLPVLESLLKRAIDGKHSAEEAESDLAGLAQRIYLSGGMRVNPATVAQQRAELESHLTKVKESMAEIDAIGENGGKQSRLVIDRPAAALMCEAFAESGPGINLDQQVGDANAR